VDANRLGQSQATAFGHDIGVYAKRFEAFGWRVEVVDGHDIEEISEVLSGVGLEDKPLVIVAKTYKGAGVSFLQDKEGWHGKPLNKDEAARAIAELQPSAKSGIGVAIPAPNQLPVPNNAPPAGYPPLNYKSVKWINALSRWTATQKIPLMRRNSRKNFRRASRNVSSPNKTWLASRPVSVRAAKCRLRPHLRASLRAPMTRFASRAFRGRI
jgi:transketolase